MHLVEPLLCSCDVVLLMLTGLEISFQFILRNQAIEIDHLSTSLIVLTYQKVLMNNSTKRYDYEMIFILFLEVEPLFIISGIFQQYLVYQVQKIRLQGYYSFSQKLKHIVRLPFAVTAYGTAALLLVMVWEPQISALSIPIILRMIMLIEAVCAGSFMIIYISYVQKYNSLNSQPDVLKSLYSPLQQSSSLEDLRYHDVGRLSDQQMALLQYQRENLHFLNEEILRLQECLSKYERSSDGSTPQVDLAHMLAARDQELRTLSAEMNQVTSELRLARSVIAERDTEIQKLLTTNKQYVEENERLRAILGEWSTRAAKLERALEAERISNLELQKRISTLKKLSHASETSEQQGS
ncbi:Transmembrane protein [Cucurbita argyrosperma subsp. argyrosperma]|nr:Transmembrane protein [Cucurbita argyrosperma subsp. argyrosperma]